MFSTKVLQLKTRFLCKFLLLIVDVVFVLVAIECGVISFQFSVQLLSLYVFVYY